MVRRLFLAAAFASVALAVLAAVIVRPGFEEAMGWKHDPWGDRDRGVACVAGFTTALAGLLAAWQGFSGLPKRLSRTVATLGLVLNLAALSAAWPFLTDWLRRVGG